MLTLYLIFDKSYVIPVTNNFPSFPSGQDAPRFKVLEMDSNGTLFLHKTSLLCVSEIIKRLTEGKYQLAGQDNLDNKQTLL